MSGRRDPLEELEPSAAVIQYVSRLPPNSLYERTVNLRAARAGLLEREALLRRRALRLACATPLPASPPSPPLPPSPSPPSTPTWLPHSAWDTLPSVEEEMQALREVRKPEHQRLIEVEEVLRGELVAEASKGRQAMFAAFAEGKNEHDRKCRMAARLRVAKWEDSVHQGRNAIQ
eukprot:Sspe_Gene.104744::Locus_81802_Transcript_1_1_Confidence_1.000_Length_577::g.104744::m.104744